MQHLQRMYAETLFMFYLKFQFNWMSCIYLAALARWLLYNYMYPVNNGYKPLVSLLRKGNKQ